MPLDQVLLLIGVLIAAVALLVVVLPRRSREAGASATVGVAVGARVEAPGVAETGAPADPSKGPDPGASGATPVTSPPGRARICPRCSRRYPPSARRCEDDDANLVSVN